MARWYEGAEESAFKPTAGGYVFQPPGLTWPFGRSQAYQVNEAQKAALAACLKRQRLQTMVLAVVAGLLGLGLSVSIALSGAAARGSPTGPTGFAVGFIVTFLLVLSVALAPYLVAARAMRPVLANAPRTDERITTGERFQRLAVAISPKMIWLGGAGGILMIIGGLMMIGDAISEGRSGLQPIFILVFGALFTAYFIYLGRLRRKASQSA